MSNVITGNPIILDTASTTAVVVSNTFLVSAIKWTIDTGGADNDECILKDKNGVIKYHEIINITTSGMTMAPPMVFSTPVLFDGLIAHTISGGTVYIYLALSNNLKA